MPENTQPSSDTPKKSTHENESTTLHTCACGEQHEDIPGHPATGMNARPRRNSAIPAAADPAMPEKKHVTAAVTGPGASNPAPDPVPAEKFLKTCRYDDQPSEDLRTAQRLYGCRQSVRALDHGPGIPYLFSLKKELFAGHLRLFSADIPEPDVPLSLPGHQNRTGKRPMPTRTVLYGDILSRSRSGSREKMFRKVSGIPFFKTPCANVKSWGISY